MAITFGHVHLKGPDPRKTAQWYMDQFDARYIREFEIDGALYVRVEIAGVPFNISGPRTGDKPGPGDASIHYGLEHFGLATEDFDGDVARLKKQGVEILTPPYTSPVGARVVFLRGPDDVRIELTQHPK